MNLTQEQRKRLAKCKYYKGENYPKESKRVADQYFWSAECDYVYESTPIELVWSFWKDMKIEEMAKNKRPDIPLDIQYYLLAVFDRNLGHTGDEPMPLPDDINYEWGVSKYLEFIEEY